MKKQLILLSALAVIGFTACNDGTTPDATTTDSTTTTTTNVERKGMMIANFDTRTFVDLKTKKPIKLKWNAEKYYYEDETGNQPYYYYDPAANDTFDYWGRRLNSYLTYSNGDYMLDETRMPAEDMSNTDTTNMNTIKTNDGDTKIKQTDDKYKEKTDTSKLKVTDDKLKIKKK